jgi:hypothetical protein
MASATANPITDAVEGSTIEFVASKTAKQVDLQALHPVREHRRGLLATPRTPDDDWIGAFKGRFFNIREPAAPKKYCPLLFIAGTARSRLSEVLYAAGWKHFEPCPLNASNFQL